MWFKWKVRYWDVGFGVFKSSIFEGSFHDLQNIPMNLGIAEEQVFSIIKQDQEEV